ncbi:MFS general substrate transporter [Corynespora cassiicola Philippines]|uniref:MFS general substrate transporter n=1 Tax=Corynespora cassiicola Philippines TaxID=1448308 RepID=A0A2T2NQI8_CORCC|nr:MFS general substrate transporter [Corynespora cassiicola Philippines]
MAVHTSTDSLPSSKDVEAIDVSVVSVDIKDCKDESSFQHSRTLWCIFFVLCLFSFLSALDGTIITTSLPTITSEIGGDSEQLYVWIANCFIFSSTAPQPLYGQIANIFGRRNPFFVAIALFTLGSGIAGGANSAAVLIAGRTVQGLGAAGLYVLSDILICDLVPPRHRGPYLSAVLSTAGIGSTIGPVIGGAIAEHNWRWIFYLNIPISVVGFAIMFILLKVNHVPSRDWKHALARVDLLGAAIFIPSMISLFYALITGGIQHSWSSWRVLLPLVLGVGGWILFHIQQVTPLLCKSPSAPPHLFTNRTSATGFILTFLSSVLFYTIAYFLPLYFQAVKLVSPLLSGVYYLPFALAIIPAAGVSGWVLGKWGKYVPLHYAGFALLAIGMGLFSMLDETSSQAAWAGFQVIPSMGLAIILTITLPSTLAPLDEADVAVATAVYSFVRSFGLVWGVTMAGIVFNGQVNAYLGIVKDGKIRGLLKDGAAYAFAASGEGLKALKDPESLAQVMQVYVKALRVVWLVAMAVSLLGFICVPIERSLELKKDHTTEYGLKGGKVGQERKENPGQ